MPGIPAFAGLLLLGLLGLPPARSQNAQAPAGRLLNLSARGVSGSGSNALAVGFVLSSGTKPMLVRGVGPTLANFGVPGNLAAVQLQLFDSSGASLAVSTGWNASLASVFAELGAFALPNGSADAAIFPTLSPGTYSANITGLTSAPGVALAEIYDGDGGATIGRLINLSARAYSGAGANVLAGGFVVGGAAPETVLLRGIGPSLGAFGVAGVLPRASLQLFASNGTLLASNSWWGGGNDLSGLFASLGAFALAPGSDDAALVATLAPGAYSAVVSGVGGGTGVALVEIYEVPASAPLTKRFHPGHYMMLPIGSTSAQQRPMIAGAAGDPNLAGFQICYTWGELEPTAGNYAGIDATIASDLAFVAQYGKQLVVQIQYKSRNLTDFPADLQSKPSALVLSPDGNYIPNLWDPSVGVQARYLALLQQIAAKCDAQANLEMVNMAESATVDSSATLGGTYTAQGWVNALQAVALTAGQAFVQSTFEEYINHITGDDSLVNAACANAIAAGCSFGGPDIDPSRNNIPAYDDYAANALTHHLGSAVQPMDYLLDGNDWYGTDQSPTTANLFSFATSPRLHVDYIFWNNTGNNQDWISAKATIDANPWPWY